MKSRTTNPAWFIKPKSYSELHYSNSSSVENLGKAKLYLRKHKFGLRPKNIHEYVSNNTYANATQCSEEFFW